MKIINVYNKLQQKLEKKIKLKNSLNINLQVLKDFIIEQKLGKGSFSTVYKVLRITDNKIYALKRIKLNTLTQKEQENALNEIRILASIKNEYIIRFKQAIYNEEMNELYIIMNFGEGGDLRQKIQILQQKNMFLEEKTIWNYIYQLTLGLKALHDVNIIHRDLKPSNVFFSKMQDQIFIADLNIAKKINKYGFLYTQTGTPNYSSPEVWKYIPYNQKSDIWSLGCLIYEMTCLKPPFLSKDNEDLSKKISKGYFEDIPSNYSQELNLFIKKMLNLNPEQRPLFVYIIKKKNIINLSNQIKNIQIKHIFYYFFQEKSIFYYNNILNILNKQFFFFLTK
ncbi:hypothetical protein IMG5_018110 [Ichthyophthirius multifiliis]|uniref:non-specific serine/threonine protein kinase n=1 Tax=Ichthyophthirius multifiliis TaxID=5932 RepID=G0QKH7_ICHMU|nr:hypothetical protein IMG5_018110 [Ichthyophthirius multifiliis]EGR34273.1 hypothetical protein IMG5_018110 [Ichthyophthirius multifiliis]|eukprot:XP_004039577.1 hypothetical protein IMG5_018110 [Ichthyophthirius multifiliis]